MRKSERAPSSHEKRINLEEARALFFAGAAKASKEKDWDALVTVANAVVALRQFESARNHFVWSTGIIEDRVLAAPDGELLKKSVKKPSKKPSKKREGLRLIGNSWKTAPGTPPAKVRWKPIAKKDAKGSTKKLVTKVESAVARAADAINKKALKEARKNPSKITK